MTGGIRRNAGHDAPPAQPRTPASEARFCVGCGTPLTGRKQRFCSDRCRMRHRRTARAARRQCLLANLRQALSALEAELATEEVPE